MSVNDVANATGVQRAQVWRWEHEVKSLPADRLFQLADLFGVDPRKLYLGEFIPNEPDHIFHRIGEVVLMVETEITALETRPAPELVRDAVLEILQQEAQIPAEKRERAFDPSPYKGLVKLIFKNP